MTTRGHELTKKFVDKWCPHLPDGTIDQDTYRDFTVELSELRVAEFHGARQAMGRDIVAKVIAITAAEAAISPDYQPAPFRAIGPFRTMTADAARRLIADENGQPREVKVFQCSLCGAELATVEEAVTHPCPTFDTQPPSTPTEPMYLVNRTNE